MNNNYGEIVVYQLDNGSSTIDVKFKDDTVWLTQAKMTELFQRDQSVISRHVNNVFKEGELLRESNMQKMHIANSDKPVTYYNLDVIISVGYRVKSKRGTQFRIWATSVLKDHLVRGFSINQKRLAEKNTNEIKEIVSLLTNTLESHNLINGQGKAVLNIVKDYTRTWNLLLQYDEDDLPVPPSKQGINTALELSDARSAITSLKNELLAKKEATELFGQERGEGLSGIIGAIQQTFGGQDLYPGVAEKAAHLLYFVIKDHPFSDGNKRIGTFLFLLFLKINTFLDQQKFSDTALVALTLLTAASDPAQKDILVRLIINLISGNE